MLSAKAWLAGFGSDAGGAAFDPSLVFGISAGCEAEGFVFGQADQPVLVGQDLPGQLGWVDAAVDGRQLFLLFGGQGSGVQQPLVGSGGLVIDSFASTAGVLGPAG